MSTEENSSPKQYLKAIIQEKALKVDQLYQEHCLKSTLWAQNGQPIIGHILQASELELRTPTSNMEKQGGKPGHRKYILGRE